MIVYFHIDELNRDAIVASGLSKICKDNGWILIYGNRRVKKIIGRLEFLFDIIILPKPIFIKEYFNTQQLKKIHQKIIILYTENIGIIADDKDPKTVLFGALNEEFMSGDKSYIEKVAAFCFWGHQVKNVVTQHFPELKSVSHVIGHPRHDISIISKNAKYINDEDKSIGIFTRFHMLNDYQNKSPAENLISIYNSEQRFSYKNSTTGDFLKLASRGTDGPGDLFNDAIDFYFTLKIIDLLINQGKRVSIKIHPRENPMIYQKYFKNHYNQIKIEEIFTPFTHWATKQKVVIGPASTSFYDCFLLGTLPICTVNLDPHRNLRIKSGFEENNNVMNYVHKPKSISELLDLVNSDSATHFDKLISNYGLHEVLSAETNFPYQSQSLTLMFKIMKNLSKEKVMSKTNKYEKCLIQNVVYFLYNLQYFFHKIKTVLYSSKGHVNSSNFFLNRKNIGRIKNMHQ
jgi:hypothetical protein